MRLFTKNMSFAVANLINRRVRLERTRALDRIRSLVKRSFQQSNEYEALDEGILAAHFGFWTGSSQEILNTIIDIISDSVYDRNDGFKSDGKGNLAGRWRLQLRTDVYTALFELDDAVTYSPGGEVYWLEWLLSAGNNPVIKEYDILFGTFASSRSGAAIMIPGIEWKVPSEYAGTLNDNWLTRTFNSSYFNQGMVRIIREVFLQ
jgi:hypothetical protein